MGGAKILIEGVGQLISFLLTVHWFIFQQSKKALASMVCGFWFLGVAFVCCLAAERAQGLQQPSLPVLSNFFSGYSESITKIQVSSGSSFISSNTTRVHKKK